VTALIHTLVGQYHAPAALPPEKNPSAHWSGGGAGHRGGQDVLKRKPLALIGIQKPNLPTRSAVTIAPALFRHTQCNSDHLRAYFIRSSNCDYSIFRRVLKMANSYCFLAHDNRSVRPFVKTRLPLDGFLWNLMDEYFSKLCLENASFVKIQQEQLAHYTNSYVHLR
jgi:hypothetical protein